MEKSDKTTSDEPSFLRYISHANAHTLSLFNAMGSLCCPGSLCCVCCCCDGGVDFLAVLVAYAGWRSTVAATFAGTDTDDWEDVVFRQNL